jgi:hypothetical protein|tara:strand:+ start:516 stop:872 length:357 start_codon:yes stop_codon:yes gene_type:complete
MAQYEEIEIDQGTDVAIEVHLVNSIDDTAKNLTNFSAKAKLKRSINSDSADSHDFLAVITSPATSGIVNLSLTNAQTEILKPGRYLYDAEIQYLDSSSTLIVERVLEGRINVNASITR